MIFIVGNSRSGTTMLGRVFGNHSKINTFGELHFFEHQVDASEVIARPPCEEQRRIKILERLITTSRDGFFESVKSGQYVDEAKVILQVSKANDAVSTYEAFLNYETQKDGKEIPCEQTPRYLFFVNEILEAFPEAFIINMIRDPRDVLLSQKNKWRRRFLGAKNIPLKEAFRSWVNYHPYTMAKLWVATVRKAESLEKNDRFVSLRFEDLLNDPEKEVRLLCKHIGIEFEDDMLNVPQVGSSTGKDQPDKKGIDASRSASWQRGGLSLLEIAISQDVAGKEMEALGYSVEPVEVPIVLKWLSMLGFVSKISLALFLNIRRSKNMVDSIRRRLLQG